MATAPTISLSKLDSLRAEESGYADDDGYEVEACLYTGGTIDVPTFLKLEEVYLNLDEIRAARFEGESVVIYTVHGNGHERYTGEDAAKLVEVLHHYRFTHAGESTEAQKWRQHAEISDGCLAMIRDALVKLGCEHGPDSHNSTPPMMYPEWIACVIRHRIKSEAGELLDLCKKMTEHLELVKTHYEDDGGDSLIKRAKETIGRHEGKL